MGKEKSDWKKICEDYGYTFDLEQNVMTPSTITDKDTIIVSWSGGWDSTALLVYLAVMFGTKDKPVIAHSSKCANINNRQQKIEQNNMKKLKKIFKKQGLHIEYSMSKMEMDNVYVSTDKRYFGLSQVPLNLFSPMMYYMFKNAVVCFGYVHKDDFWTVKTEAITAFVNIGKILGNPNPRIAFPMCNARKQAIYDFLNDLGIVEYTSYCEDPRENGEPCGICGSCQRVRNEVNMKQKELTTDSGCDKVEEKEESYAIR